MSEFVVNGELFGRYAKIQTAGYEEPHIYKIVSLFKSNSYCDVPLYHDTKPSRHSDVVPVVNVIHCGLDETKVERVALKDCELIPDKREPDGWIKLSEGLPEEYTPVFIAVDGKRVGKAEIRRNHNGRYWYDFEMRGSIDFYNVTHWMPLLLPPREERV